MAATLPTGWRDNPAIAEKVLEQLRIAREKLNPARVWSTPGELAQVVDPKTVQTPALELLDEALVWAYTTPDARLIVSMSPQEGKSQRATRFGSLWALTRDPTRRIGIASYAQSLAESFGRDIRNWIASSNGFEGSLDLRLRIARDSGAAGRWSLAGHGGGVLCVGVGSGLTGRALDALIIDDPFASKEQADSPTYRQKVWDWWQAVGSTRLAPGAPVIVILTRWHEDDLAGRLLKAEDGKQWRVINIPALADHRVSLGETDPLGREPGTWLLSARGRTKAQWEAIRIRSGAQVFNALYQGRPSPETGNVWQRQWWRRYETPLWSSTGDGRSYTVEGMDEVLMSWDMTFKDTKTSDFVVGQVWARRGANAYLLDQVHRRLTFTETLTAFEALVKKWPQAKAKLVEDKANGTAVMDTLRSRIPGIVAINPTESKIARANAVSPFIEAGNVHLPSSTIALFSVGEFVDEAAMFPNGAHDDQVDAASQALARIFVNSAGAAAWLAHIKAQVEAQQLAAEQVDVIAEQDARQAARQLAFRNRTRQ